MYLKDNQSSMHIMCNPDYMSNIRAVTGTMHLKSNSGKLPINKIADFEGFNESVLSSEKAITNILSLSRAKNEYVHRAPSIER